VTKCPPSSIVDRRDVETSNRPGRTDLVEPTRSSLVARRSFLSKNVPRAYVHTQLRCKYHCKYTSNDKCVQYRNKLLHQSEGKQSKASRHEATRYSRSITHVVGSLLARTLSLAHACLPVPSPIANRSGSNAPISRRRPSPRSATLLFGIPNRACRRVSRYDRS